jgi:hypothetical protein
MMMRKLLRGITWFALGFVGLFSVRLAIGPADATRSAGGWIKVDLPQSEVSQSLRNAQNGPRNIASYRLDNRSGGKGGGTTGQKSVAHVDQKYEKVAAVSSRSSEFASDEGRVRAAVTAQKGVIQVEQSSGLEGSRYLYLGIGVPPDRFDGLIAEVRKIGQLTSIQITKKDKTNEYQDLNAQRVSLEKSRAALITIKAQGGRLDEMVNLEKRLLELEESIQKLGVRLGEFDSENEFVTVQFTLVETRAPRPVSWLERAYDAFEWTVKYYLAVVAILFFAGLCSLIAVTLVEKLAWIPAALRDPPRDPPR